MFYVLSFKFYRSCNRGITGVYLICDSASLYCVFMSAKFPLSDKKLYHIPTVATDIGSMLALAAAHDNINTTN